MTDTLLRSLRDRMLDESEPLAGLLRKCLLLGAETGSQALREWARKELSGYGDDDEVPSYRSLVGIPISMDSTSGNFWATGQKLSKFQLPEEAWEYVPDSVPFKQPVEELEQMAGRDSLSFTSPGLSMAQTIWNRKLGPFQNVHGLSYSMTGSVVTGMLGKIRTKLMDVIADLTADTPLSQLPSKDQVDSAVNQRLGVSTMYQTTIHNPAGPVAVGTKARATVEGLSLGDVLKLLDTVQEAVTASDEQPSQVELLEAVDALRLSLAKESPETGEVVKGAGKLRSLGAKLGESSVVAATESAASALMELALGGAFG